MGIPHLKRDLEPYAPRTVIEPCNVVVDGPALAYHILNLCSKKSNKTCPAEQPSYSLLGETVVAWLEKAESCGLVISQIYFDGFLPTSKQPERIQRLQRSTNDLVKYHSTFSTGVPKRGRQPCSVPVELFPAFINPGSSVARPPHPPFLVPAIIDALRCSKYGSKVNVVGGEADGFCASHVREFGGMILTSDSDLLVYDLGKDGTVVFLSDIDADLENNKLVAPQYSAQEITRKLSLKPDVGFSYLAFEIFNDRHLTLEQAAERSRRGEAVSLSRDEYNKFISSYLSPEMNKDLSKAMTPSDFDPRVSEIVYQYKNIVSPGANDVGLQMYLPFLLDYPARTSAWEASKPIRQLAYCILQATGSSKIGFVSEFRRLQSASSGARVDVPSACNLEDACSPLMTTLKEIAASVKEPTLKWVILSIYQDIVMTFDQGKGYPLGLDVLAQDAKGKLDPNSWEFLHVLAQAQATYYSLRMLHQISSSYPQEKPASGPVSKLLEVLSKLPALEAFPSTVSFADTLELVRTRGGPECLISLSSDMDGMASLIKRIQQPPKIKNKKARKRKAASGTVEGHVRARPSNPFELLNGAED